MNLRFYLIQELARRQRQNSAYSLRAFARSLGLSPTSLSLLLSGRRELSIKSTAYLVERLPLDTEEKKKLMARQVSEITPEFVKKSRGTPLSKVEYQELDAENFRLIADWYHYGILGLSELSKNKWCETWISKSLGITLRQARDAMERLLRLKLVVVKAGGSFVQATAPLKTSDGVVSEALRLHHAQHLELARRSLDEIDVALRDLSSVTFGFDIEQLPEFKKQIRDFRRRLNSIAEKGNRTQVYTLAIQLFPVSKIFSTRKQNSKEDIQ